MFFGITRRRTIMMLKPLHREKRHALVEQSDDYRLILFDDDERITGFQTAENKKIRNDIPIIFLTALTPNQIFFMVFLEHDYR